VGTTSERVQRHILATSRERGAPRRGRARTRRSVLALEPLEDRTTRSTVRRITPAGGDRDATSNWDGDTVPSPGDVVFIGVAGAPTITHNPGERVDRHALSGKNPSCLGIQRSPVTLMSWAVRFAGKPISFCPE
jgi:hypothetical protein